VFARGFARFVLLLTLLSGICWAAPDARESFEAALVADLHKRSPESVDAWNRANAARDAKKMDAAIAAYDEVIAKAPDFSAAHRRKAGALRVVGRRADAIGEARKALDLEKVAPNYSTLALALMQPPAQFDDQSEAEDLAQKAIALEPNDDIAWVVRALLAVNRNDAVRLSTAAAKLRAIAPDEVATHVWSAMAFASAGDFDAADAELDRASALGADPAQIRQLRGDIDSARPFPWRAVGKGFSIGVVAWGAFFLLLWLAGSLLSKSTLRAIDHDMRHPSKDLDSHASKGLRSLYRRVIALTSFFYFASLPLLVVVTIAATGGVMVAFVAMGWVPLKLMVILAIVGVATLWAIVKSVVAIFRTRDDAEPGIEVDFRAEPKIEAMLARVADRVGTRPVDRVYLQIGTSLAVFERGSSFAAMRGGGTRCLLLGVALLDGMTVGELEAVVAHEYGHFRNEDTAGGTLALAVRRSVHEMIHQLVQSRAATIYNPAFWFLRAFLVAFNTISQGASRLQEVLADRVAVLTYGSAVFEKGLSHVIRREAEWHAHVDATIQEVVDNKLALSNLYAFKPKNLDRKAMRKAAKALLEREQDPYDSHPSPRDRIAYARALDAEGTSDGGEESAWSLLSSRKKIERRLTREARKNVERNTGIVIPEKVEEPATEDGAPG